MMNYARVHTPKFPHCVTHNISLTKQFEYSISHFVEIQRMKDIPKYIV